MKQNQNKIAAIDHKHANSWPLLIFSSVAEKNWPLSRGYLGSWGHGLVAIAVVETFNPLSPSIHTQVLQTDLQAFP